MKGMLTKQKVDFSAKAKCVLHNFLGSVSICLFFNILVMDGARRFFFGDICQCNQPNHFQPLFKVT